MPVVRTDGLAVGRSVHGHVITKFSRMGSSPPFFLSMVLRCTHFARNSSAIMKPGYREQILPSLVPSLYQGPTVWIKPRLAKNLFKTFHGRFAQESRSYEW